ncbi:MAG TPA: hypothetical protein VFS12_06275 [Terriglobia bacterium]|nr:hypothetical protein [Terriglobia bacterium]
MKGPATKVDPKSVSSAKKALLKKFSGRPWFRGAGIAPSKAGLKLRLNVTPDANATRGEIPKKFRGFDVEVVLIDTYKARGLG